MKVGTMLSLAASALIPRSIKRTMLMVCVFRSLEKSRGVVEPRLDRFNEQLKLANDPKFLFKVDDLASDVLKAECPVTEGEPLSKSCEAVMEWAPKWLKYGSRETMVKDISRTVLCSVSSSPR